MYTVALGSNGTAGICIPTQTQQIILKQNGHSML